jgi:serine/threonine-protein kinase RsbW
MKISFSVCLPVDINSVPFARGLCRQALQHLGVDKAVIDDITLALTEACANVIQHAALDDHYELRLDIDNDLCRISVLDNGGGFDLDDPPSEVSGSILENGPGLLLMQALVDTLHFQHAPDGRHHVMLNKRLITEPPAASGHLILHERRQRSSP